MELANANNKSRTQEGWANTLANDNQFGGYRILSHAKKHCFERFGPGRPLIRTCGHKAHLACVEQLRLNNQQKAMSSFMTEELYSCNIEEGEFLCPLCKQISNCVVPSNAREVPYEDDDKMRDEDDLEAEEKKNAFVDTSSLYKWMVNFDSMQVNEKCVESHLSKFESVALTVIYFLAIHRTHPSQRFRPTASTSTNTATTKTTMTRFRST